MAFAPGVQSAGGKASALVRRGKRLTPKVPRKRNLKSLVKHLKNKYGYNELGSMLTVAERQAGYGHPFGKDFVKAVNIARKQIVQALR